jgi:2-dehydropantoate 2-reductase
VPLSSIIRPFLATPTSSQKLPTIVLIQNGVGIEDEPYEKLVLEEKLAGAIISCCAWVGCNLVDGGKKIEHGSLERLEMGLFPTLPSSKSSKSGKDSPSHPSSTDQNASAPYSPSAEEQQRLQGIFDSFVALYKAGGGGAAPVPDIQPARWRKLLWNASWGGLCALSRQPVGALISEGSLHFSIGVVRRTMLEVLYVARACGYGEDVFPASAVDEAIKVTLSTYMPKHLPGEPASAEEQAMLKRQAEESISEKPATTPKSSDAAPTTGTSTKPTTGAGLSPGFKPSILLDLEAGRPMETVPIFESVIERARLHGMETPRLDLIMASLRPSQVAAIDNARRKQASAASEGSVAASASGGSSASAAVSSDAKGANAKNLNILSNLNTPMSGPNSPLPTPKFRPGGVPVPESLKDGYF